MRAKNYRLTSAPANSVGINVVPMSEVGISDVVFIPIGDIVTYSRKIKIGENYMLIFQHNNMEVAFTESQASKNLTEIRIK